MSKNLVYVFFALIIGFMVIRSCNRSSSSYSMNNSYDTRAVSSTWKDTPVKNLVDSLSSEQNYAVLLSDMNATDNEYLHKYRIVVQRPDTVFDFFTGWKTVPATYFNQHVNDLGMEVLSKKNGVIQEEVAPAGYSHFVGNDRYGRWRQRDGYSFWEFYGQYAFMSTMFNLMSPVRRSYYDDYYTSYYGTGRRYYGPSGSPIYGTSRYTSTNSGRNTTWASKPSTFKQSVRDRVSRSASRSTASASRTSRSSSRSSSRTSYRSRSGGFGK